MTYEEWEHDVPTYITSDSDWRMKAYRLALFLSDLSWYDASKIVRDSRLVSVSDQLYRSCGKIGSSICEGYSRGTGRDRARFYEYALGSLREARDWYYKSWYKLTEKVMEHRMALIAECIKLVLTMIQRDRKVQRMFDEKE